MNYVRYYLGAVIVGVGIAGFLLGGQWVWLGIATYLPLALADGLLPKDLSAREFSSPALADLPLYVHCVLMAALFASVIAWSRAHPLGVASGTEITGAILTLAWLGAVPNLPVNHEIMHRRHALAGVLTRFTGAFYGDPLRDLAHVHGHHLLLGTELDGDTARRGDTIYNFAPRAARDAIRDAWRIECARLDKLGIAHVSPSNVVLQSYAGLAIVVLLAGFLGGALGGIAIALGMVASRLLVEAFNYYQHYGIVRVVGSPYGPRHLWNHLSPVSRTLGFEITNHADHHMDPYRPFYRLHPNVDGPQMPSIFVCFLSGIIPPIWFRTIAMPRLRDWDVRFATDAERELARQANRRAGWPDWTTGDERA